MVRPVTPRIKLAQAPGIAVSIYDSFIWLDTDVDSGEL